MAASIGFDIYAHDHASRTFNRVGDSASRSGMRLRKFGAVAKVAALGAGAAFAVAGVAAYKLAKGAMEDEAAAKRLAVQLHNSAGATKGQVAATERWISAQGVALGVTDDELRPALTRLVTATHNVRKAQKLASLAMDVSAGSGKSLEAVSTALMKAQNGQVSGLSRLGVQTKDAKGKTLEFEQIQKNLAKTFHGQAAKAADTTAGRFARLKLIMSETGESIGYRLLPPLTRLAGWVLTTGIPAMSRFGAWFDQKITPSLNRFGAYVQSNVVPALRSLGHWIGQKVVPVLADLYQNRIKGLVSAFGQMRSSVKSNEPQLRVFGSWLKKTGEIALKVLGPALKFVSAVQLKSLVTAFRVAVTGISVFVSSTRATIAAVKHVGAAFVAVIGPVARFQAAVVTKAAAVVRTVAGIPGRVKAAVGNLGSLLFSAGSAVVQGLIDGIQAKVGALTSKLHAITSLIPKHKGPLNKDKALLTPAGKAIMDGLIAGIESRKKPLELVLGKVTDLVKARADKVKDLLGKRRDFAAGFQFGDSIFATPDTEVTSKDAEGNDVTTSVGPTLASMKAFAIQQKAQAAQVDADVKRLVGLGLSKSLIAQMQSQGAAGIAQMHALAGGSASDIQSFNALDKDTRALYGSAGMAAGNAEFGDDIRSAKRDERMAQALAKAVADLMKGHTRKELERLEFRLEGRTLVATLKKEKRDNGDKPLGLG